jgi:phosphate transport system substrate-binding protein
MKKLTKYLLTTTTILLITTVAQARDQIRIVGSSTVYPFATVVAEKFGISTKFKTPVVESTGSGGGLKIFCQGIGPSQIDITNSSRRIKGREVKKCAKNGITDITEVKIGYDGIVIANSKKAEKMNLNRKHIWLALGKNVMVNGEIIPNPHKTWKDVDPSLPNTKIEVLGPPPTSGTRDAFVELALEGGCKKFQSIKKIKKTDKKAFKRLCHTIREDGIYIEAGENDNLIISKLEENTKAFGVFGYSFLDQNKDRLQGSIVEDNAPTFENISSGKYPISRSLYFYIKNAHVGKIPGISEYIAEFTSEKSFGTDGYLQEKGLIPSPDAERAKIRTNALGLSLAWLSDFN